MSSICKISVELDFGRTELETSYYKVFWLLQIIEEIGQSAKDKWDLNRGWALAVLAMTPVMKLAMVVGYYLMASSTRVLINTLNCG